MPYRLYVRPELPDFAGEEGDHYSWVLMDASGESLARGDSDTRERIEHTLAQNALDNVLLTGLIPGDEALFCFADIPARQTRFVHQALPYAVEEQVAQDIESVHLAMGQKSGEGYRVAAIDHQRMNFWMAVFSGWQHARLEALYPDAALLPVTENGWSICVDGDWAMFASHRGEWLRMQSRNLDMFAETLAMPSADEVQAEVPVIVYGTQDELEHHQPGIGELAATGRLGVQQKILELSPLELLAHAHHHHLCQPINLCQGRYSLNGSRDSALRPWRPLLAVAAVWFVVQVAVEAGMGLYHQQQAQAVSDQAMAIYREAFPGDTRTHAGNVRRVIEGQLMQMSSGGEQESFIALLKYTGEEYAELTGNQSVVFNSVNYSRSRGELVVDVRADNYSKLSALRNGLADEGLEASIGSVVNEADGARGRLTVSGG